jgi:hypothetical protein
VTAVGPTHKGRFPLQDRERPELDAIARPVDPAALSTSAYPAIKITDQSAIATPEI